MHIFTAAGLILKFIDPQVCAEEETPSLPSETAASALTTLTPRMAVKRKLDECSMPLPKNRAGPQRKKKALDHYKFVPKSFAEKTSKEKAKCKQN